MTAATQHPVPPDWSGIAEDILCPLCEYNLRGVQEPRCPECGYQFAWNELLDPDRRRHEYLFEHHSTHRIRWFRRTLWGGLRPGQFWRSLQPVQAIYPRRLLLYGLLVAVIYTCCIQLVAAGDLATRIHGMLAFNAGRQAGYLAAPSHVQQMVALYGTLDAYKAYLESTYPTHVTWSIFRACLPRWIRHDLLDAQALLGILAWPVLTFVALLVFQISMRRARVRTAHVLRCVVYSCDALAWIGLVAAAALALPALMPAAGSLVAVLTLGMAAAAVAALFSHMLWRLVQAYRLYLRFDHPVLTVLASQVIAGLALVKVYAVFAIDLP